MSAGPEVRRFWVGKSRLPNYLSPQRRLGSSCLKLDASLRWHDNKNAISCFLSFSL